MKKFFLSLALLLAFTSIGLGQGSGPITVKEVDGSPVCNNCRTFVFPNGSLTVSGNKVTVASGGGGGGITIGTTTVTSGTTTRVLFNNAGVVGEYAVTGTGNAVLSESPTLTGTVAAAAATFSGTITQTSASATAFVSGLNGATTPAFVIDNSTAIQASGMKVIGKADGIAPELKAISRTQITTALAGNGLAITADPAIAGSATAGAAAGGSVTITAGDAARLTSGSAIGGSIFLIPGTSIGTSQLGGVYFDAAKLQGFQASGSSIVMHQNGLPGFYLNTGQGVAAPAGTGYFLTNTVNDATATRDTGIARQAAGVVRIVAGANGSGAQGSLLLGSNTVGSIGTSGVGVFAIANGTAPTSSPADEFQLYSADAAAGAANAYIRNEAGEINRLSGLSAINTSSFAKTSDTTLANVTGLTRPVEAGRTYAFRAELDTTAAVTGGVKFAVSGTATATSINYSGVLIDGTTILANTRATALNTTVCASTTSTAGTCTIKGVVVINSGGTLTIQFAQNASDGSASTVLVNQSLQLIPIS